MASGVTSQRQHELHAHETPPHRQHDPSDASLATASAINERKPQSWLGEKSGKLGAGIVRAKSMGKISVEIVIGPLRGTSTAEKEKRARELHRKKSIEKAVTMQGAEALQAAQVRTCST